MSHALLCQITYPPFPRVFDIGGAVQCLDRFAARRTRRLIHRVFPLAPPRQCRRCAAIRKATQGDIMYR